MSGNPFWRVTNFGSVPFCGWTKPISHHFETMVATLFLVGMYRGIESFHRFSGGGCRSFTVGKREGLP